MSSVNGFPDHVPMHIVALLDWARRRQRAEIAELSDRWLKDLDDGELRRAAAALHGSQFRLLSLIPPGGARVTDIAELAGITKQSAGTGLSELATWHLVETLSDPADGRARITRRTTLGDELVTAINRLVSLLERRWRKTVGAADYDTMRRALARIVASERTAPVEPSP